MAVRLLHLADLHLGYEPDRLGDLAALRGTEFADAFKRAVDFALEASNQIHAVLIAGDLFERHAPSEDVVSVARAEFRRLLDADIPALVIPGTHDGYFYPDCVYRTDSFDGATLLTASNIGEPVTLSLNGDDVHFYGMAYLPSQSQRPFDEFRAEDLPGYHVAMIHGSLMHNPNWDSYSSDVPLRIEQLTKSGMHYIALGHYHTFQQFGNHTCKVVYCGSLECKHARDGRDRRLVVAELDEKGIRLETHPFEARPVMALSVDVTAMDDVSPEALAERLKAQFPEGAIGQVALEGSAEVPVNVSGLLNVMQEHLFHLSIDDQTLVWKSARLEEWAEEPTVRGRFVRRMIEKISEAEPQDQPTLNLALKLTLTEFMQHEKKD